MLHRKIKRRANFAIIEELPIPTKGGISIKGVNTKSQGSSVKAVIKGVAQPDSDGKLYVTISDVKIHECQKNIKYK